MSEEGPSPKQAMFELVEPPEALPARPPIPPYPHDFGILSKKPGSSLGDE